MAVELFDFRDHLAEPIGDDTACSFQAMTSIPVAHVPGQSLWQAAEPFNAELSDGIRRRHHLAALSTVPRLIPKTPAKVAVGVPAELSVKRGAAHGWPDLPADMTQVADWFDKYLAAPVGNCRYSDIAVFSFHPVKIITTGEGGVAVTNDVSRRYFPTIGLGELVRDPFSGWVRDHSQPQDLAAIVMQYQQP